MARPKHRPTDEAPLPDRLPGGLSKGAALCQVLEELATRLGPAALIPSERVLADHFEMSRTTVRQSVERLLADGVLFRRHGHGTFVAGQRPGHIDMLSSFSRDMRARGLTPGAKVLSATVEPATAIIAAQLEIGPGAPVFRLERLRTADGRPMAVERIAVPVERFPGLDEVDWTDRSFYQEMENRWGVFVRSAESRIAATLPDPADAALLGTGPRQPCLLIEGFVRDADDVVFEAGRSCYRGDQYDAVVRVQNRNPPGSSQ